MRRTTVESKLLNYREMRTINKELNERLGAVWECAKCHSNSLLPIEYGCDYCQPFKRKAKLIGRIYESKGI